VDSGGTKRFKNPNFNDFSARSESNRGGQNS
jgi:hypothetical protein